MQTDQLIPISIGAYTIEIEPTTMMGSLTHLWEYGNSLRAAKGLCGKDLIDFMRSSETLEFIAALERKYGKKVDSGSVHRFETDKIGRAVGTIQSEFVRTKRGKGGGTWVHLMILLRAATYLDGELSVNTYELIFQREGMLNLATVGFNAIQPSTQEHDTATRRSVVEPMLSSLYIADFGSRVKIGRSKRPTGRLRSLETQSGCRILRHKIFYGYGHLEQKAHDLLRAYRSLGEYFTMPFEVACSAIDGLVLTTAAQV